MTTSDWIATVGLLFSAATLTVLLWTTFWRTQKPTVVARLESAQIASSPRCYYLVIHPIPGWEGTLTRLTGEGVQLALPATDRDEYNASVTTGPLRIGKTLDVSVPLYGWDENLRRVQLYVLPSAGGSVRRQTKSSIRAEIRFSSPKTLRMETKISANVEA